MLLSQYYNRRSSLEAPKREESHHEEDDIVNSFYEERRSRSNKNTKQHSLLRKNISYFHQDEEEEVQKGAQAEASIANTLAQRGSLKASEGGRLNLTANGSHSSRPPIPTKSLPNVPPRSLPKTQTVQAKLSPAQETNVLSELSSNFSTINLSKQQSCEEDYKQHLKSELSKRINIKHYLTEISEENKENPKDHKERVQNGELKYNYDVKVPHRQEAILPQEISRISFTNSHDSRLINESRQSMTSILQESQNNFEFSRNTVTDRLQNNSTHREQPFSHSRHSHTLGDSGFRSSESSKKTEKEEPNRNVLMGEELEELQENSHPLRQNIEGNDNQPTTLKHNMKYFEPEAHAEYKRRIGDLEREVEDLKGQHKREEKFIQSIFKMRRLMDNLEEDCSLKELWRWIKHLPQRK